MQSASSDRRQFTSAGMVKGLRVQAGVGVLFALVVAACTGTGAPATLTAVPAATEPPTESRSPSPTFSPSPSPIETAAPSEAVAPTESPAPSKSFKPLPSIDQAELDAYMTSSITLIDLADDDLAVTVSYLDPESEQAFDLGTYLLEFSDQITNQVPQGTYRLDFRQPADSTTGASCTLEIGAADAYVFAALQDAVAISLTGAEPKDAGELFISTSPLCGR
jgi:hypothetical protein